MMFNILCQIALLFNHIAEDIYCRFDRHRERLEDDRCNL